MRRVSIVNRNEEWKMKMDEVCVYVSWCVGEIGWVGRQWSKGGIMYR